MTLPHHKILLPFHLKHSYFQPGNTKGGSITEPLTSCLTCWDQPALQIKTKIVSCHTAGSKPVKQGVNRTVIFPRLVFPAQPIIVTWDHTYLKKSRLLKFVMCPASSAASSKGIFAAATNSAKQTNKAGGTCHQAVYLSQMSMLGIDLNKCKNCSLIFPVLAFSCC